MVCPYCGGTTEEGAIICPSCHQVLPLEEKKEMPKAEVRRPEPEPVILKQESGQAVPIVASQKKETGPVSKPRRKKLIAIILVVALIMAALASYYYLIKTRNAIPAGQLDLIPENSEVVVSINLNQAGQDLAKAQSVINRLTAFNADFGLSKKIGLLESSLGLSNGSLAKIFEPNVVLFISDFAKQDLSLVARVKDEKEAAKELNNLKNKLGEKSIKFDVERYKKIDITKINYTPSLLPTIGAESSPISLFSVNDNFYIASGPDFAKKIIDSNKDKKFISIKDNKDFSEIESKFSASSVWSYATLSGINKIAKTNGGFSPTLGSVANFGVDQVRALGFGTTIEGNAIKLRGIVAQTDPGANNEFSPSLQKILPPDTVLYYETQNLGGALEGLFASLEREDPFTALNVSAWQKQILKDTNFDLDKDFFAKLSGKNGVAVIGGNKLGVCLISEFGSNDEAAAFLDNIKKFLGTQKFKTVEKKEKILPDGTKSDEWVSGEEQKIEFVQKEHGGYKTYSTNLNQFFIPGSFAAIPRWIDLVAFDNYFIATNDISGIWKIIDAKDKQKLEAAESYQTLMAVLPQGKVSGFGYLSTRDLGQLLENIISPLNLITKIGKVPPPEVLDKQSQEIVTGIKPYSELFQSAGLVQTKDQNLEIIDLIIITK